MTNEENGRIMTDTDALLRRIRYDGVGLAQFIFAVREAADLIEQLVARDKQQAAEIEHLRQEIKGKDLVIKEW